MPLLTSSIRWPRYSFSTPTCICNNNAQRSQLFPLPLRIFLVRPDVLWLLPPVCAAVQRQGLLLGRRPVSMHILAHPRPDVLQRIWAKLLIVHAQATESSCPPSVTLCRYGQLGFDLAQVGGTAGGEYEDTACEYKGRVQCLTLECLGIWARGSAEGEGVQL